MLLDLTVTFNKEAGKRESGKASGKTSVFAYAGTIAVWFVHERLTSTIREFF